MTKRRRARLAAERSRFVRGVLARASEEGGRTVTEVLQAAAREPDRKPAQPRRGAPWGFFR